MTIVFSHERLQSQSPGHITSTHKEFFSVSLKCQVSSFHLAGYQWELECLASAVGWIGLNREATKYSFQEYTFFGGSFYVIKSATVLSGTKL